MNAATAHMAWHAPQSFWAFLAVAHHVRNIMRNAKARGVPEPATKVATESEHRSWSDVVRTSVRSPS